MMIEMNMLLAALVTVGGLLVYRAYAPHILWRDLQPSDFLALSIAALLTVCVLRAQYWDIYWPLSGGKVSTPLVNACLNSVIILAESFALKARLMMIPERVRDRYNLITCAWYPRNVSLNVSSKEDTDDGQ